MFAMIEPQGIGVDASDFHELPTAAQRCLRGCGSHDHHRAEQIRTSAHRERQRGHDKRKRHLVTLTLRTEAYAADLQREAR